MPEFSWPNNAKAAVSLTFDDARTTQLDVGIPILDTFGLKGTFFVSPELIGDRLAEWRAVPTKGHEIGNHTMTHPCSECFEFSRERKNALEDYDLERMAGELDDANSWIAERFGSVPTSFAYPCGHTSVGRGRDTRSYIPLVAERFIAGRLYTHDPNANPFQVDLAQTWSCGIDRLLPDDVLPMLESGLRAGDWLVLTGHEIAVDHPQGILPETLTAICEWAREKHSEVWVDTVSSVARHLRSTQNHHA